jgi:hypothetical protein
MVSLSDHDNLEASTLLRLNPEMKTLPISVEWTVPFGAAVFHIGIHNMPSSIATELMSELARCTESSDENEIKRLIAELQDIPSLLLVFNHPVWNFTGIPRELFNFELKRFLKSVGAGLHAFELNGMRSHQENHRVIRLAAEWSQIVVSGGDRHACEANAMLNLTNATDFAEFVQEVRIGRRSTILMMPQYNDPLNWRFFRGFADVVRDYPEHPRGQRQWDERTFHPNLAGEILPLKQLWPNGSPGVLKTIFEFTFLTSSAPTHWTIQKLFAREPLESLAFLHEQTPFQVILDKQQFI